MLQVAAHSVAQTSTVLVKVLDEWQSQAGFTKHHQAKDRGGGGHGLIETGDPKSKKHKDGWVFALLFGSLCSILYKKTAGCCPKSYPHA
jgi:hypothetical protein